MEIRHQRLLQPVTTTMGASGVRALVDRRITPQPQGAKVRTKGAKVKTSISTSRQGMQQQHSTTTTTATTDQDQHSTMQQPLQLA